MRTTVNIDEHVLKRAREIALRTSRPLGEVVDDALRALIQRVDDGDAIRAAGGVKLPTDGGDGLMPGVDLEDKEALVDLLDRPDDPDQLARGLVLLADVNVFLYARRRESPRHEEHLAWLEGALAGDEPFGVSEQVLSSFVRIVTNHRAYSTPTPPQAALDFCDVVLTGSAVQRVRPGARHWEIFTGLCRRLGARGNVVPDAYLAALAIENNATWITTDRGFARFEGLRWRTPLDD